MNIRKLFHQREKNSIKDQWVEFPQDIQALEKIVKEKNFPVDTAINYFVTSFNKLKNVNFDRSLPCPATWELLEYRSSIKKIIYYLYQNVQQNIKQANLIVIAEPEDPDQKMKELIDEGINEKEIACINRDCTDLEEKKILKDIKNGKYSVLIAKPFTLGKESWKLGNMDMAAKKLNARMKYNPAQQALCILFIITPEIMTTLQLKQSFDFIDAKWNKNFNEEIYNKEAIMLTCLETAENNRIFLEFAQKEKEWNIDIIADNFWAGINVNDLKELSKTVQRIHNESNIEMKRIVLESAIKHLKAIYDPTTFD